jgi:hypothetical protein
MKGEIFLYFRFDGQLMGHTEKILELKAYKRSCKSDTSFERTTQAQYLERICQVCQLKE